MENVKRLSELRLYERAEVKELTASCDMRRRLLDIGLVPSASVMCVGESPLSGMRAYRISGAKIAIRNTDADGVILK